MNKHSSINYEMISAAALIHNLQAQNLTSARPLGPKTNKATTPITKASGAPTPNKDANTRPLHFFLLSAIQPFQI